MEKAHNKVRNTNDQQEAINVGLNKMPKNIRQIGSIDNHNKAIYVEDYVMTFMKQLSSKEYSGCKVAVLLGHYIRTEVGKNLFIKGAVEMKNTDFSDGIAFSDEGWTSIYENIKKYFTEVEIIGWSLIGPEFFIESGEKIRKVHNDNFAGSDKTMLKINNIEKEEAFYLYENNYLVKQTGYYIYYEKNEEMQNYMVENNDIVSGETNYNDQTTKKIRSIIQEKKEKKDDKSVVRLLYAASTLLAVIVLVIAATMLRNYDQMKDMEYAINAITENFSLGKDDDNQVVDDSQVAEQDQVDKTNQSANVSPKPDLSQDEVVKAEETQDVEETNPSNVVDDTNIEPSNSQETVDEPGTVEVETISGNIIPADDQDIADTKGDPVVEENNPEEVTPSNEDVKDSTQQAEADAAIPQETTEESAGTKEESAGTKEESAGTKEESAGTKDESAETTAEVKYYVVKAGDSLAGISFALYNSANYIKVIQELNGIEDMDVIYEGQKLIVP